MVSLGMYALLRLNICEYDKDIHICSWEMLNFSKLPKCCSMTLLNAMHTARKRGSNSTWKREREDIGEGMLL